MNWYSQIIFNRQSDGSLISRKVGWSPFLFFTNELLQSLSPEDDLFSVRGRLFRVVVRQIPSRYMCTDMAMVMAESPIAQLLAMYYKMLDKYLLRIVRLESKLRQDFIEGETLPFTSVSGLLARTLPVYR